MIQPKRTYGDKIMETLEKIGLSKQEREKIFSYVSGERGEEALQGLTARDFYQLAETQLEAAAALFSHFCDRHPEEAKKMLRVLFALGQSTCGALERGNYAWRYSFMREGKDFWGLKPEEWLSVVAETAGRNNDTRFSYLMDQMIKQTKTPEYLLSAMKYCIGDMANGRLILLSLYFLRKYPDKKLEEPKEGAAGAKGILNRLVSAFGNGNGLSGEDAELMRQYETIVCNTIEDSLPSSVSKASRFQIARALKEGSMTDEIRSLAGPLAQNNLITWLICGTAFMNMALSPCLMRTVDLYLASDMNCCLPIMEQLDFRRDLHERGGSFDELFHLDSKSYISWAAIRKQGKILCSQLKKNKELYLECLNEADLEQMNYMMNVVRSADPKLYKTLQSSAGMRRRDAVIKVLTEEKGPETQTLIDYLYGRVPFSALYPYEEQMAKNSHFYRGYRLRNLLDGFPAKDEDREFFNRCQACTFLRQEGYFMSSGKNPFYQPKEEAFAGFFKDMEEAGMDEAHLLKTFILNVKSLYLDSDKERCFELAARRVFLYKLRANPEAVMEVFRESEAEGRRLGLMTMALMAKEYKKEILSYAKDTAKSVREELLKILEEQKDWKDDILVLLSDKKAGPREAAVYVLDAWNDVSDRPALEAALEKEKNAKVRRLLTQVLGVKEEENESPSGVLKREDLVKALHKGGKSRTLSWAFQTPFPAVHFENGEEASVEYLQAILLCYAGAGTSPGVNKDAEFLAGDLKKEEFSLYVNELFDRFMEQGAEAKKKWVLYAASIHGGNLMVKKLYRQIQEWPANARGAMACEAVNALALSPVSEALLKVDGIASKFKFRQVKAAAAKALEFAAGQLGITREELSDRIVPDLGFNERMERVFDYGARSFTVSITPELEIQVRDQEGRKLKNMPTPGKRDEEDKAARAYEEFKAMKKQLKTVAASQKQRLELALSSGRMWKKEDWVELFTKKPVMHPFAIGLIWGIYKEETLTGSFRYMEDGSFNTVDEEELELPEDAVIGLIHPIELSKEERDAWKEQLEDYEIIQPVEQLDRTVYLISEEEVGQKAVERFEGVILNDLSLIGKMQSLGWYTGSVQDAGCFYTFYREDGKLGAELHFSGTYIGGQNEEVTIEDVRFYPAGTIERGSYVYDEADDKKALLLEQVPPRYFSEIILQLSKVTASKKEQ